MTQNTYKCIKQYILRFFFLSLHVSITGTSPLFIPIKCTWPRINVNNNLVQNLYNPETSGHLEKLFSQSVWQSIPQPPQERWVTIFVHGIMSIKPHVTLNNFFRFMKDDIDNTVYAKTVEYMRNDPFFYCNQAMQSPGLIKLDPTTITKGNSSNALALLLDEIMTHTGQSTKNDYYTFGWSGLMSNKRRFKDAVGFLEALQNLHKQYEKENIQPKYRIIGYSHGGNVVLNIARARQKVYPDTPVTIEEAILLGMPVLTHTDHLVTDPIFKRIYHLYSTGDRVQQLDFFGSDNFFSGRFFQSRPNFQVPDKVKQIRLKVTRCKKTVYKNKRKFDLSKNFNNIRILSGKSKLLRDSSPGHAELWFFGWTPLNYRDSFPLNPLPTISVLPYLTKHLPTLEQNLRNINHLTVDIRPEHEVIVIRPEGAQRKDEYAIIPFITQRKLEELGDKMFLFAPESFTNQMYQIHIKQSFEKAQIFFEGQLMEKLTRRTSQSKREKQFKQSKKRLETPIEYLHGPTTPKNLSYSFVAHVNSTIDPEFL